MKKDPTANENVMCEIPQTACPAASDQASFRQTNKIEAFAWKSLIYLFIYFRCAPTYSLTAIQTSDNFLVMVEKFSKKLYPQTVILFVQTDSMVLMVYFENNHRNICFFQL